MLEKVWFDDEFVRGTLSKRDERALATNDSSVGGKCDRGKTLFSVSVVRVGFGTELVRYMKIRLHGRQPGTGANGAGVAFVSGRPEKTGLARSGRLHPGDTLRHCGGEWPGVGHVGINKSGVDSLPTEIPHLSRVRDFAVFSYAHDAAVVNDDRRVFDRLTGLGKNRGMGQRMMAGRHRPVPGSNDLSPKGDRGDHKNSKRKRQT